MPNVLAAKPTPTHCASRGAAARRRVTSSGTPAKTGLRVDPDRGGAEGEGDGSDGGRRFTRIGPLLPEKTLACMWQSAWIVPGDRCRSEAPLGPLERPGGRGFMDRSNSADPPSVRHSPALNRAGSKRGCPFERTAIGRCRFGFKVAAHREPGAPRRKQTAPEEERGSRASLPDCRGLRCSGSVRQPPALRGSRGPATTQASWVLSKQNFSPPLSHGDIRYRV